MEGKRGDRYEHSLDGGSHTQYVNSKQVVSRQLADIAGSVSVRR